MSKQDTWPRGTDPEILDAWLKRYPEVRHIAYHIYDYNNIGLCTHSSTVARAQRLARSTGSFSFRGPLNRVALADGDIDWTALLPLEDVYWPDWTTLRPSASGAKYAFVQCWMWTMWPADLPDKTRYDPRAVLARAEKTADDLDLNIKIGTEIEWLTLERPDAEAPANPNGDNVLNWVISANRSSARDIVAEAVESIEYGGGGVWKYNFEGPPSKWEIALEAESPLRAIDDLVSAHQAIKNTCHKHGLHATMYPRAFEVHHAELHMPTLTAFLLGDIDSYGEARRQWYGGGYVMLGGTIEATVRQIAKTHWEIRVPDTLTNPYLEAAAIVAAGVLGVRQQLPLASPHMGGAYLGPTLPEKAKEAGIRDRLPEKLEDALDLLDSDNQRDNGISSVLGHEFVTDYLRLKRFSAERYRTMDPEKKRKGQILHI